MEWRLDLEDKKIKRSRDSECNFMYFFLNLELQNTELQLATSCGLLKRSPRTIAKGCHLFSVFSIRA